MAFSASKSAVYGIHESNRTYDMNCVYTEMRGINSNILRIMRGMGGTHLRYTRP